MGSPPVHRMSVKQWQVFARKASFAYDHRSDRWHHEAWLSEDAVFLTQGGRGEPERFPRGLRCRIVYPLLLGRQDRAHWERLDRSRRLTYCRTGHLTPARVPVILGGKARWMGEGDLDLEPPAPTPPPAVSWMEDLL